MSTPENVQARRRPEPISAEEFDRRVEEGEDMDEFFGWQEGALVAPGELSPGQKESLLAMFRDLPQNEQISVAQMMFDAMTGAARESLVQWVGEHSVEQRTAA